MGLYEYQTKEEALKKDLSPTEIETEIWEDGYSHHAEHKCFYTTKERIAMIENCANRKTQKLRDINRELKRVLQSFVNFTTIGEDIVLDDIVKQAEKILKIDN